MKIGSTLILATIAVGITAGEDKQDKPIYTPNTFYEQNYDFAGNGIDIGNAPSRDVDGCLQACLNLGTKCKAFSWSNYNNGTCWLKSSKGQAVYKSGVISSGLYDSVPKVCKLGLNLDVVGYDLTNQPAKNPSECCGLCQNLDKCRVYSWSNHTGGTCWLKSGHDNIVFKDGVQSSSIFPDDNFFGQSYVDKDFVGHDIANKPGKLGDCAGICNGVAGCRAYAWNSDKGGTCWLKAKKDQVIDKAGVTSGVIAKALAVPKEQKDNTDYIDNDFQNVAGIPIAEDCVQICADTPKCAAVTWNNYRGGTCWLKHTKGNEVTVADVKAFVL